MSGKLFAIGSALVLACALQACYPPPVGDIPDAQRKILVDVPNKRIRPSAEILSLMKDLSLLEKYEVYRYGVTEIHHRKTELGDAITPYGSEAVPFLREKLVRSNDAREKLAIIDLFIMMNLYGCYNVKRDKDLYELILREQRNALNGRSISGYGLSTDALDEFRTAKRSFSGQSIRCQSRVEE